MPAQGCFHVQHETTWEAPVALGPSCSDLAQLPATSYGHVRRSEASAHRGPARRPGGLSDVLATAPCGQSETDGGKK